MWVALEGCLHGQLDCVYDSIRAAENNAGVKVDLLICCGDFQATRDNIDLLGLSCPPKFRKLNDFHKYYTGEKVAPVLTIFIGGNHEASSYMQQLPCGGWVAPNIYYMGYCGVVNINGLRVGGLSGIFNNSHYRSPHYEKSPYTPSTLRSVYHIREIDVFRLSLLSTTSSTTSSSSTTTTSSTTLIPESQRLDVFLSHDWPKGIALYGNVQELVNKKKFLKSEIGDGSLGSPPAEYLLHLLQPSHWFSAHLHVKYAAMVRHDQTNEQEKIKEAAMLSSAKDIAPFEPGKVTKTKSAAVTAAETISKKKKQPKVTKFLSLDKAIPGRRFLQLIHFETGAQPDDRCESEDAEKLDAMSEEGKSDAGEAGEAGEKGDDLRVVPTLKYDEEWLAILRATHKLWNTSGSFNETMAMEMRVQIKKERAWLKGCEIDMCIPPPFAPSEQGTVGNVQMDSFLHMLNLEHAVTSPCGGGRDVGGAKGLVTKVAPVAPAVVPAVAPAVVPAVVPAVAPVASFLGTTVDVNVDPDEIDL